MLSKAMSIEAMSVARVATNDRRGAEQLRSHGAAPVVAKFGGGISHLAEHFGGVKQMGEPFRYLIASDAACSS